MQRFFDIVFSGIALVLLSPLLLPLMFILRVTGEGEIFFPQSRVGLGGKHFKLYKFATMLKDSPNIGTGTVTIKMTRVCCRWVDFSVKQKSMNCLNLSIYLMVI